MSQLSAASRAGPRRVGRALDRATECQLRLQLPTTLPPDLMETLTTQPLLGGSFSVDGTEESAQGQTALVRHNVALFSAEELLIETHQHRLASPLLRAGWLLIGDGGDPRARSDRRHVLYAVELHDSALKIGYVVTADGSCVRPAGFSLEAVILRGAPHETLCPRRRVPSGVTRSHTSYARKRRRAPPRPPGPVQLALWS